MVFLLRSAFYSPLFPYFMRLVSSSPSSSVYPLITCFRPFSKLSCMMVCHKSTLVVIGGKNEVPGACYCDSNPGDLCFNTGFCGRLCQFFQSDPHRGHCPKHYWQLHRLFGAIHPNANRHS